VSAPTHARASPSRRAPRSAWRLALQGLGFLAGAGVLAWCVHRALGDPAQRAQLSRLLDAPWWAVAGMLGLSLGAIACDGLMFRAVLSPVRRLPRLDLAAVGGVCSALAYLPFKMSLLFRFVHHHRRDGVPILTIGAWVAATGALLLASVVPVVTATLTLDPGSRAWWWVAIAGVPALGLIGHLLSRALASDAAWRTIVGVLERTGIGLLRRAAHGRALRNLHGGVRMLADPLAITTGLVFRSAVVAAQAARFMLAARIAGVEVSWDQALVAGAAYNLVQAVSPGGVAGFREAGAAGAMKLLHGPDLLSTVLVVTIAEAVTNLLAGTAGAVYLRVDRLLLGPARAPEAPVAPPVPVDQ